MTWFFRVSHLLLIPHAELVQVPPPMPTNEEVIIEEDHARDLPNTLGIIHTLYGTTNEKLRDCDSVEYFQDLLSRMHDKMRPTTTLYISKNYKQQMLRKR